jgi:hypothetical protein
MDKIIDFYTKYFHFTVEHVLYFHDFIAARRSFTGENGSTLILLLKIPDGMRD